MLFRRPDHSAHYKKAVLKSDPMVFVMLLDTPTLFDNDNHCTELKSTGVISHSANYNKLYWNQIFWCYSIDQTVGQIITSCTDKSNPLELFHRSDRWANHNKLYWNHVLWSYWIDQTVGQLITGCSDTGRADGGGGAVRWVPMLCCWAGSGAGDAAQNSGGDLLPCRQHWEQRGGEAQLCPHLRWRPYGAGRCLSGSGSVCPSVCLFACLSVCLPACLPVCLPACLAACLSVCLSVYLSVCLSVYLSVWLLYACLPACLPICLSVCLFACLSVYLSVCLSIYLSVWLISAFLPACLSDFFFLQHSYLGKIGMTLRHVIIWWIFYIILKKRYCKIDCS